MNLYFNPKRTFYFLLKLILCLLLLQVIVVYLKLLNADGAFKNIINFFYFDHEGNLPTFYSSLALLFSSFLLLIIAFFHKNRKPEHYKWLGLSLIFAFLSIDEITVIHEHLWARTHEFFNTTGLLYYAWYIPYGFIMIILLAIYIKFFLRLPKRVMLLFSAAAVIFVLGAIGFEAISGVQDELNGQENLLFYTLCTMEELFEMSGVAIFIYALLTYISDTFKHVDIKIA